MMSNVKNALTQFLQQSKAKLASARQTPKLSGIDIQLLSPPKLWNWDVSGSGTITKEQYEFCDFAPQDCEADTYTRGSRSFSGSYNLFIEVLGDGFVPESLLENARKLLIHPDEREEEEKKENPIPLGWTKVPDSSGALRWQLEWSVDDTPNNWLGQHLSATEREPIRIPISGTPVELFFDTDSHHDQVEITESNLESIEFYADAWGTVPISIGNWYQSEVVDGAKDNNGPFKGNYTLSKFFDPGGHLSCRVSEMIIALNPSVKLISKEEGVFPEKNTLQNLQQVKLGDWVFQDVKPQLNENSHSLDLNVGATPGIPQIIAVILEKSYNEQTAHSFSQIKKTNTMDIILTLAEVQALILAAIRRFRQGNDTVDYDQDVRGIPIFYTGIHRTKKGQLLWNCGPPWRYQLHVANIGALRDWWQAEFPDAALGTVVVSEPKSGHPNINVQLRARNGILFNFHVRSFTPAHHGLMKPLPSNDIQISSDGKVKICANGKYKIGIGGESFLSKNGKYPTTTKTSNQENNYETKSSSKSYSQPMEAYPMHLLEKIEKRHEEQRETINHHAEGLVVEDIKVWHDDTINISFKGGSADLHRKIATAAKEWTRYGSINLDFGENTTTGTFRLWTPGDTSEIRIGFDSAGYWSLVGTDSLDPEIVAPGDITMNFQGFDEQLPEDWAGTVLHEFGHALGFHHEHQSPNASCDFDWPKIYRTLAGAPNYWDEATVNRNLKQMHHNGGLTASTYDVKSIMHYHFAAWMFVNGANSSCYTPKNNVLSDSDKMMMTKAYPFDEQELAQKNEARLVGLKKIILNAPLAEPDKKHYKTLCKKYEQPKHVKTSY